MANFVNFSIFLFALLSSTTLIVGNDGNDGSEANPGPTNLTEILRVMSELLEANFRLEEKVAYLESKMNRAESSISSLDSDFKYFNPTVEHGEVWMDIDDWTTAVESDFQGISYPFEAGQSLRSLSTWAFYLSLHNGSLSAHLQLESAGQNQGALFAGFTVFVIDSEGTTARNKTLPSTRNVLNAEDRTLSIPNVITLSEIEKPGSNILKNDSLRFRFTFELLGKGHKLYKSAYGTEVSKDRQTIEFEVEKLKEKMEVSRNGTSIAFSRFQLRHPPSWRLRTEWIVDVAQDVHNSLSVTLGLADSVNQFGWLELFAAFKLEIWNDGKMLMDKQASLKDYMKEKEFLEGIRIPGLNSDSGLEEPLKENDTFLFKIYLTVFGKEAKYYVDIHS